MTSTTFQLITSIGLSLILCALIIQIRLSSKTIQLLKQLKIAPRASETELAVGSQVGAKVELAVASEIEADVETDPKNERLEATLQDEIITTVFLKMFTIRNSVHKQISNIHVRSIENAPKKIGIDQQLLLQSYSKNKLELINLYWELFNSYIQTYWTRKNNGFKTVFSGDIDKKTGDVGKMIVASEQLLVKLDQLLVEFQEIN